MCVCVCVCACFLLFTFQFLFFFVDICLSQNFFTWHKGSQTRYPLLLPLSLPNRLNDIACDSSSALPTLLLLCPSQRPRFGIRIRIGESKSRITKLSTRFYDSHIWLFRFSESILSAFNSICLIPRP